MKATKKGNGIKLTAYELFEHEKEKESWTLISENEDVNWTTDFINDNKDNLDWRALSFNYSLAWSPVLIRRYESYWDWHALSYILADKRFIRGVHLDKLLIRYKEKIDWNVICQGTNLKDRHLEIFSDVIDWNALSSNNRFDWSESVINTYIDKINWKVFTECLSTMETPSEIQTAFRKKVLSLYTHKLDFGILSSNDSLVFTAEIIEEYKERWNWAEIINNPAIEWHKFMLKKYDKYISTISPEQLRVSYMWTILIGHDVNMLIRQLRVSYKQTDLRDYDARIAFLLTQL